MSDEWKTIDGRKALSFNGAAESAFGRSARTNNTEFNGAASSAFGKRSTVDASVPVSAPKTSRFSSALNGLSAPDTSTFSKPPRHEFAPEKVGFNEAASSAFGKKSVQSDRMAGFDDGAASAFGKKPVQSDRMEGFDDGAASAFGKKRGDNVNGGFNEAAASAFGKKRSNERTNEDAKRPTIVFEKTNTLWALMSNIVPEAPKKREWTGSAVGQKKKKAEDEAAAIAAKKGADLTNMDLFPVLSVASMSKSSSTHSLGTPTTKTSSTPMSKSSSTPSLGAPVTKSSSSLNFAEIMRKRKEQEEREAEEEAARLAKEQADREREAYDRIPTIGIRFGVSRNTVSHDYMDEEDYGATYDDANDLDYVHPSERGKRGYYQEEDDDRYDHISDHEEEEDNSW